MISKFVRRWLMEERRRRRFEARPFPLWVYGDAEHRDEFLAALIRRAPHTVVIHAAPPADDSRSLSLGSRNPQTAAITAIVLEPDDLRDTKVAWRIDPLVNARYTAGRTTVILSSIAASSAYDYFVPGLDEYILPRIVGRILEDGDCVGLAADGAFVAEHSFTHRASGDYRIELLRRRTGRVRIEDARRGW